MFPLVNQTKGPQANNRPGTAGLLQDRAPGLKDGIDRFIGAIVKSLQTMAGTTTTIEGLMAGVALEPLRDVIAAHPSDAVAGLIECAEIGCKLLVTLNGRLVHSIVELLSGGNGVEPVPDGQRPATAIDQQFSQILVTLTAAAVQSEWAEAGFGPTRAAKIEGSLAADLIGARIQEVAVVRMTIGAFGQHGTLRLVLPPAALDRFGRDKIAVAPAGDDPAWRDLLRREIGRAAVTLDAYLDAKPVALSGLAALEVGQILALPVDARARVSLVCDGRVFYRGEVGQDDGRYSLRIEEIVGEPTSAATLDLGARRRPLAASPLSPLAASPLAGMPRA